MNVPSKQMPGGPQSQSGQNTSSSLHGHPHGPPQPTSNQTRYLCALYGLIKYDTSAAATAPGTPSPPIAAVANLCSLLRAMCHSDGQRLIHGRQATASSPVAETSNATASTPGQPRSVGSAYIQTPQAIPPTPSSPFFLSGPSPSPASSTHSLAKLTTPTITTPNTPAVHFPSIPTFHQTSYTLLDATATPTPTLITTIPPTNTVLQQDLTYLTEREKRLQPIVALAITPSQWTPLVPQRFSRYVRVYHQPIPVSGTPNQSDAQKTEMQAWREIEVPSFAPVPTFHGIPSSSVTSPTPAMLGAAHESWRLTYLGKSMLPTKTLCHVRPIRVTPVSTNYTAFLEHNSTVPYEKDYEFIQEGFRFEDRDGLEILVYQVLKLTQPNSVASASIIRGNRWLCEVRSLCYEDSLNAQQTKVLAYSKAMENSVKFTKLTPEGNI